MGALKSALTAIFNANNYTSSTSGIASKKIPVNESNGLPSGQMSVNDLAQLTSGISSTGGVFVCVWESNYLRFRQSSDAASIAASAVGAAIYEGGKLIIIAKDEASSTLAWGASGTSTGAGTTTSRKAALADFDGEGNTTKILAADATAPAAKYCHEYAQSIGTSDSNYNSYGLPAGRWHLPSAGELFTIWAHLKEVNQVLKAIGGTQFSSAYYWSSTEYTATYAWGLNFGNGYFNNYSKTHTGRVRPVSAWV